MVFRCYSEIEEKICLHFFPCKNIGEGTTLDYVYKHRHLTIFYDDYTKLLLKFLKEIYPTQDPTDHEIVDAFDECFMNWIGKEDWVKIVERIKEPMNRNHARLPKNELEFYANFIEWIETQLESVDLIVVEGNL